MIGEHNKSFSGFLTAMGLPAGAACMVHSAFTAVRRSFPGIGIEEMIHIIQERLTADGSLIMPTFTYCFKRKDGSHEVFDRNRSPSKVGAVSEVFRSLPGVIRTASPTHSFALWGKVTEEISRRNAPTSPLGAGSVLEWLTRQPQAHILLLGVDFSCLSYGHYLETIAPTPWADFSPWDYLGVETIAVSIHGEQPLRQVPGCARSFVNFEHYLLRKKLIRRTRRQNLSYYILTVAQLHEHGTSYFRRFPFRLLCPPATCRPCDARREHFSSIRRLSETTAPDRTSSPVEHGKKAILSERTS